MNILELSQLNYKVKIIISSEIIGKELFVTGKDEANNEISIKIERYQEIISFLKNEIRMYGNLYEIYPKGTYISGHFKNCVEVYSKRLDILEKYELIGNREK